MRGIAVALCLALGACSLQGLDDLTPPFTACTGTPDCEPLNERDGIAADTCERWVCVEDFCRVRRPGTVEESCNGADDDCDTRIDESGEPLDPVVVLDPPAALQSIEARASGGATALFVDAPSDAVWRATVLGSAPTRATDASFATSDSGLSAPTAGCVGSEPGRDCAVVRAAIAHVEGDLHVVAARVARGDGPLRIGPVVDREITLAGPDARSSSWRGLDTTDSAIGPIAASSAVLDRERIPSVLFAVSSPEASGGPLVRLVGVWSERDASGLRWTHATDVLVADPVLVASAPAASVTALAGAGWLVAYPSLTGLAWILVAPLGDPAPRCSGTPVAACVTTDERGLVTQVPASAVDPRPRGAIDVLDENVILGERMPEEVVAAAGRTLADGAQSVALAYVERDEIHVVLGVASSVVSLDLEGALTVAAREPHDLSISYVPSGVRTGEEPGGYVLAWRTSDGTYVARIPDAEPGPVASFVGPPSAHPRAFLDDVGGLSVAAGLDRAGLVVFPHACGPRR